MTPLTTKLKHWHTICNKTEHERSPNWPWQIRMNMTMRNKTGYERRQTEYEWVGIANWVTKNYVTGGVEKYPAMAGNHSRVPVQSDQQLHDLVLFSTITKERKTKEEDPVRAFDRRWGVLHVVLYLLQRQYECWHCGGFDRNHQKKSRFQLRNCSLDRPSLPRFN